MTEKDYDELSRDSRAARFRMRVSQTVAPGNNTTENISDYLELEVPTDVDIEWAKYTRKRGNSASPERVDSSRLKKSTKAQQRFELIRHKSFVNAIESQLFRNFPNFDVYATTRFKNDTNYNYPAQPAVDFGPMPTITHPYPLTHGVESILKTDYNYNRYESAANAKHEVEKKYYGAKIQGRAEKIKTIM